MTTAKQDHDWNFKEIGDLAPNTIMEPLEDEAVINLAQFSEGVDDYLLLASMLGLGKAIDRAERTLGEQAS